MLAQHFASLIRLIDENALRGGIRMNQYTKNRLLAIVELNRELNEGAKGGAAFDRRIVRKARKRNLWLLLRP